MNDIDKAWDMINALQAKLEARGCPSDLTMEQIVLEGYLSMGEAEEYRVAHEKAMAA